MPTPIAEWLFDEAASGDAPTVVSDSQSTPADLDKNAGTGSPAWTEIAAGRGYDLAAATADCYWSISTSGNKLTLASKQKVGVQIVFRHADTNAAFATLAGLPDAFGGGAPFYLRYTGTPTEGQLRFYFNDTHVRTFSGLTDGQVYVLTIAVDTTQATANDRIKSWIDTDPYGSVISNPAQDATMTSWNGGTFGIAGHPDGAQFLGAVFYAALYVDDEVDGVVSGITSMATALLANNDASPDSGGGAVAGLPSGGDVFRRRMI